MYLYKINLTKKEVSRILKIESLESNNDFPIIINLMSGNKILLLHGQENGSYALGTGYDYREFTSNDILNMYRNEFYTTPNKTIFTINCYGGYSTKIINPLGLSIIPVFESKEQLLVKTDFNKQCMFIKTFEKLNIPKELKGDIQYVKYEKD